MNSLRLSLYVKIRSNTLSYNEVSCIFQAPAPRQDSLYVVTTLCLLRQRMIAENRASGRKQF